MDRRELLKGAGVAALATLAGDVLAQQHHHEHHMHGGATASPALVAATGDCIAKGDACLAHCLVLLGDGDKEMAACAKSVNQMLAVCTALQKLAIQGSRHAAGVARVALEACTECEKECRRHENKHAECKACAESCAACARECKAMAA